MSWILFALCLVSVPLLWTAGFKVLSVLSLANVALNLLSIRAAQKEYRRFLEHELTHPSLHKTMLLSKEEIRKEAEEFARSCVSNRITALNMITGAIGVILLVFSLYREL